MFAAVAPAQQSSETVAGTADTLQVNVSLVNMFFTVRDRDGRLVKHLGREQFRVTDNGSAQRITHFAESSDQPLALAIALDRSASVRDHFEFEREATAQFLRSILRPGKDQALLITFDRQPHLAVPFTDNPEKFVQAMAGLKAEGGTALFDAARMALDYLAEAGPERKLLVLVTDGEDTVSWTTQKEVLAAALSANVMVYTLGVKADAPGSNQGGARHNLVRLSEETGGVALFPKERSEELGELFGRLEEELRYQYSLGYALPPPDGRAFHQVEIKPAEKNNRVRARRGYYYAVATLAGPSPRNRQQGADEGLEKATGRE